MNLKIGKYWRKRRERTFEYKNIEIKKILYPSKGTDISIKVNEENDKISLSLSSNCETFS